MKDKYAHLEKFKLLETHRKLNLTNELSEYLIAKYKLEQAIAREYNY